LGPIGTLFPAILANSAERCASPEPQGTSEPRNARPMVERAPPLHRSSILGGVSPTDYPGRMRAPGRTPSWAALALSVALSPTARADLGPPWTPPGGAPLGEQSRSLHVLDHDEPIHTAPSTVSPRRGATMADAFLPVYGTARGPGCIRPWVLVGPSAWVCGDRSRLSRVAPLNPRASPEPLPTGLPFTYYFVGPEGSFGYDRLGEADVGVPNAELQPGFAIAIVKFATPHGDPFGLTTKRLWLPMRDLGEAPPSPFSGIAIENGVLDVGWTHADETRVYRSPRGSRVDRETLDRQTPFRVLERSGSKEDEWVRAEGDRWLRRRDVRMASLAAPPAEARPLERWIDVDLENQIVVAYEGPRPVFATLASTGKGKGSDPRATPIGVHRVWIKLRSTDMTNLEDTDASRHYAIEEVPWVMFFEKGYGLHGAFWHRSFGRVRSHGCVNLSPRDAKWFFDWSSPTLPAGWRAVLPNEYDPGTLVRVR
jgi:hypothetical protein